MKFHLVFSGKITVSVGCGFLYYMGLAEYKTQVLLIHSRGSLQHKLHKFVLFNPVALRKAKIVCNFGLSECNRVKSDL